LERILPPYLSLSKNDCQGLFSNDEAIQALHQEEPVTSYAAVRTTFVTARLLMRNICMSTISKYI
jgi:hypothetical protein